MKKIYLKPETLSFAIEIKHSLLSGSITEEGDNLKINTSGENMTSGTINAHQHSIWDDEE